MREVKIWTEEVIEQLSGEAWAKGLAEREEEGLLLRGQGAEESTRSEQ